MNDPADKKIALLIDGDNAQPKYIEGMLAEAAKIGKVTIRRIYGDWTTNYLAGWKELINKHSFRPVQKFAFTTGKNSTDTAMIIDAMDILHGKTVNAFCIVSSDSDYTGLAQRIREEGVFVMGIGEAKKTALAFINACELFVSTENLASSEEEKAEPEKVIKASKKPTKPSNEPTVSPKNLPLSRIDKQPINLDLINRAVNVVAQDDGYAYMGEVGIALRKLDPGFDPRTYNYWSLTNLFKKGLTEFFDIDPRDNGSSIYVKHKRKS